MAGNWKEPEFDFSERSDRVTLKLEVGQVVYIPGAADIRNENTDQAELKKKEYQSISDRMEIFQRRRLWICAITSLEQVQEIYQRN